MPAPERTTLAAIVQAGRAILETEGPARLTMQAVAARVGVRPPSLYKRVRNRDDLVGLITEATVRDLGDRLTAVESSASAEPAGDARRTLAEMARAIRAFAHQHPAGFALIFAPWTDRSRLDVDLLATAVAPMLRVATALAGEPHALAAARTVTAWANGFIGMELAGAFNLGGDVDGAYEFGITRIADALAAAGSSADVDSRAVP